MNPSQRARFKRNPLFCRRIRTVPPHNGPLQTGTYLQGQPKLIARLKQSTPNFPTNMLPCAFTLTVHSFSFGGRARKIEITLSPNSLACCVFSCPRRVLLLALYPISILIGSVPCIFFRLRRPFFLSNGGPGTSLYVPLVPFSQNTTFCQT